MYLSFCPHIYKVLVSANIYKYKHSSLTKSCRELLSLNWKHYNKGWVCGVTLLNLAWLYLIVESLYLAIIRRVSTFNNKSVITMCSPLFYHDVLTCETRQVKVCTYKINCVLKQQVQEKIDKWYYCVFPSA